MSDTQTDRPPGQTPQPANHPGSFADLFARDAVGSIDLSDRGPTDGAARRILERSRELLQADAALARAEGLLERLKARRNRLATVIIPTLMESSQTDSIGVPGIGVDDPGVDIVLEDFVFASIKKESENRDAAFAELERLGGGDLVQASMIVKFPREDLDRARVIADELRGVMQRIMGNQSAPPVDLDLAVHHGTLTSWLKEELRRESERAADGVTQKKPDLGLLGATVGRVAKIVRRRLSKSSRKSRR